MGGVRDSSKTRVQPVLSHLQPGSEEAEELLRKLLALCPNQGCLPRDVVERPGTPTRVEFEERVAPSEDFLRWLIENPKELNDAANTSKNEETKSKRDRLIMGIPDAREEALRELQKSRAEGSGRKWWALEGFTSVDCLIETDRLLLFIEGKRTDSISTLISWYAHRNQVVRNLECARQMAQGSGRAYAVLVIAEEAVNKDVLERSLDPKNLRKSLPHLDAQEQEELLGHLLGDLTWQELVREWGLGDKALPDTVADVERPQ